MNVENMWKEKFVEYFKLLPSLEALRRSKMNVC
jgi:hypothetical protein